MHNNNLCMKYTVVHLRKSIHYLHYISTPLTTSHPSLHTPGRPAASVLPLQLPQLFPPSPTVLKWAEKRLVSNAAILVKPMEIYTILPKLRFYRLRRTPDENFTIIRLFVSPSIVPRTVIEANKTITFYK